MEQAAASVSRAVRASIRTAARNIRAVAKQQVPKPWRLTVAPGVMVEQRVTPLERVGCYVPGGRYPLPSSLLMTAIPAKTAGVSEVVVACPRPDAVVMAAALEAGVVAALSCRRGARRGRAGLRHGLDTAGGQDRGSGQPLRGGGQGARGSRLRHRLLRGADRDRDRRVQGPGVVDRRRPDRAGGARPRRPGRADYAQRGTGDRRRGSRPGADAGQRPRARVPGRAWRRDRDEVAGRSDRAGERGRGRAPGGGRRSRGGEDPARRVALCRPVVGAGSRRLRDRLQPRAAHRRNRTRARRPVVRRLRPPDHRAARDQEGSIDTSARA